jgi:hypothetical protein
VPVPDGVNTPLDVMLPPVADQVTPVANAPVPLTVAEQVEVLSDVMEDGVATTEMPVTVGEGLVTVIAVEPETFV